MNWNIKVSFSWYWFLICVSESVIRLRLIIALKFFILVALAVFQNCVKTS